ncbi:hypothetical protein EVAR_32083_1 [Eumeta japonica]|uniref:Uncharacterized protein n=1 Tax=Eumeta variegata TaxID=151549 RepID=A0A4C1V5W2_EUMVA|nr:hypothetical protein EVAR_32083_1 [Eumeta japonica]
MRARTTGAPPSVHFASASHRTRFDVLICIQFSFQRLNNYTAIVKDNNTEVFVHLQFLMVTMPRSTEIRFRNGEHCYTTRWALTMRGGSLITRIRNYPSAKKRSLNGSSTQGPIYTRDSRLMIQLANSRHARFGGSTYRV